MKRSFLLSAVMFAAGIAAGLLFGKLGSWVQPKPNGALRPPPAASEGGALAAPPRPLGQLHVATPSGDVVRAIHVSEHSTVSKGEVAGIRRPARRSLSPAEVETALKSLTRRNLSYDRQYQEMYDLAGDIGPADVARYLAVAEKLGDAESSGTRFGSLLLTRWAEQAPRDAMEWVLALRPSQRRDAWIAATLDTWTRVDPKAAEAWVRQNSAWRPQQAWHTFLTSLAVTDSEGAVAMLSALPPDVMMNRRSLDYTLVRMWAMNDPTAAIAWAENAGSPSQRRHLITSAVSSWAAYEPAAAAAYAAAVTQTDDRRALQSQVAQAWARTDADAAVAWVQAITDDTARNQCLQSVAQSIARAEPDRAVKLLELITSETIKQQALASVISLVGWDRAEKMIRSMPAGRKRAALVERSLWSLGHENPAMMISLVEELATELTPNTLSSAAGMVAEYNVPKALEICRLVKSASVQQSALQSVVGRWAVENPTAALAYAESLPDGATRTNCINHGVQAWAATDPQAAIVWASRFKDLPYPNPLSSAISAWAGRDPSEAADYVSRIDPGTPFQRQAAMGVLSQWSWKDPAAAAAWALGFPEGETRVSAITTVVSTWCGSDEDAATAFVQKLPAGQGRDKAIETIVGRISHNNPERAIVVAGLIGDAAVREQRLTGIAQNWMRNDPEAAKAWVTQAPLSDEQKRMILGSGK